MKNIKLASVVTACMIGFLGITFVNTAWTKSVEEKTKDWIDNQADALKRGVDQLGDDFDAAQDYLNHYHWKGVIEEEATSGPATLKHLELNGHSKAVVVYPGEQIEAQVECHLNPEQCSVFRLYRIVVGMKGEGPQAVIGNETGFFAGQSIEKFTLVAPDRSGIYQIRFRTVEALTKTGAIEAWVDKDGNEPDGTTTIGLIVVK